MAFPNMKPVSRSPVLGGVARTVAVEWPNLRFEDGDVAIRLSNEEDGIVILNSSGLSQASGYFKALLSDTWHPAKHVRCADGGIRSFNALKLQYDAHLRMAVLVSAVSPTYTSSLLTMLTTNRAFPMTILMHYPTPQTQARVTVLPQNWRMNILRLAHTSIHAIHTYPKAWHRTRTPTNRGHTTQNL